MTHAESKIFFSRLLKNKHAILAIKLMIAANDLQYDFVLNRAFVKAYPDVFDSPLKGSMGLYGLRLMCGHMLEALDLVRELKHHKYFKLIVSLNQDTQEAYNRLMEYRKDGKYRDEWNVLVQVRHNGTFHYEQLDKCIEFALKDIPAKSMRPPITDVDHGDFFLFPQRYLIADMLQNHFTIHKLLKQGDDTDLDKMQQKTVRLLSQVAGCFFVLTKGILEQFIQDNSKNTVG